MELQAHPHEKDYTPLDGPLTDLLTWGVAGADKKGLC